MMIADTLCKMRQDLCSGLYSSREVVQHLFQRIKALEPNLNSLISVYETRALAEAQTADTLRAQGDTRALLGLPIIHKDIFCVEDMKTSCGSRMLDNFIAPYDATIVAKARAAGAITIAKANMDEFAMGSSNETSFYGPTRNPWDVHCVPGGSSGGSAAAVAAGLAPAATGSDTGGSIRQPAAFCGITGLKPTYGRLSRYGMVAYASSLDQAGPMAWTAEDCALLLEQIAGFDPKDATSVDRAVPQYTQELSGSLNGLRIGLPKEFLDVELAPEIHKALEALKAELSKLGARFESVTLPHSRLGLASYYILAPAEASANLARFDGVRYGYRAQEVRSLDELYERSRSEAFGDEVKRRILLGTYVLSSGFYEAYYQQAQKVRNLIRADFEAAFKQVDVILGPTTPTAAFRLNEKNQDPLSMALNDLYTIPVNLAGLPALSVPAGFQAPRPLGMQFIGNYFKEAQLLKIAHLYQQVSDWHLARPTIV